MTKFTFEYFPSWKYYFSMPILFVIEDPSLVYTSIRINNLPNTCIPFIVGLCKFSNIVSYLYRSVIGLCGGEQHRQASGIHSMSRNQHSDAIRKTATTSKYFHWNNLVLSSELSLKTGKWIPADQI